MNLQAFKILPNSGLFIENFIYKNKILLFFVIFGLQLILNTYKIGENSLWFDESFSVNTANRPISDVIGISKTDPNPPLYPLILHFWMKIFGISEFAVRLLSAVAGSLACSFLFLFALRFFNWQTAVFSMLMFFSSNVIFYYAQEARTYSFVLLFVVLSNYCYLRLTKQINTRKGLLFGVLLGLFNIGLFYLHFLSCFSIIAQVILVPFFFLKAQNVKSKEDSTLSFDLKLNFTFLKYYCLSWVVFFLMFLPWYNRFLYLVKEGGRTWWLQKPVFTDFRNCIYEFFTTREMYQVYSYSLLVVFLLIVFKKFRNEGFNAKIVLFAIVSGPILLYLNYLVASYSPIFLTRYVLFMFLGFILFYSYVISFLKVRFEIKFLALLIVACFSFSKMVIPREIKQDYKGAVAYLSSIKKDNILITTDLPDVFSYYYDKKIFNEKDAVKKNQLLFSRGVFAQIYDVDWPNRLDFSNIKEIYYTQSFEYLNDPEKITRRSLNRNFECVEKIDKFVGIPILHFVNNNYKERK